MYFNIFDVVCDVNGILTGTRSFLTSSTARSSFMCARFSVSSTVIRTCNSSDRCSQLGFPRFASSYIPQTQGKKTLKLNNFKKKCVDSFCCCCYFFFFQMNSLTLYANKLDSGLNRISFIAQFRCIIISINALQNQHISLYLSEFEIVSIFVVYSISALASI